MVHARRDGNGTIYCGADPETEAFSVINRAVFNSGVRSDYHLDEYCPKCKMILDWEVKPTSRPAGFNARALVLAESRLHFNRYCSAQPPSLKTRAICVTEGGEFNFMRGLDPLGWEIHIAGEPPVKWVAAILLSLCKSGFGDSRLAAR
jgi:hypothetical protein